jgi:hypothetical protein
MSRPKDFIPYVIFPFLVISVLIITGCGRKEVTIPEVVETVPLIAEEPAPVSVAAAEPQIESQVESQEERDIEVLVCIGDDIISADDFKEELSLIPPDQRENLVLSEHRSQFLELLINHRVLLKEAERRNVGEGERMKKLIQRIQEQVMIQELVEREIADRAEVTDEEIEKYYLENQLKYMEPAKIRASHILVDTKLIADKILLDLREGADFAKLAGEYSLDAPTKDRGGDIGYFPKDSLLKEFEDACEKLKIGEISEVVKTDIGYHIIKVSDKKEAQPKTLEELREHIKSELSLDREVSIYDDLIQALRSASEIEINTDLLNSLTIE